MLAVFDKSVAKCPEGLKNAESEAINALKDDVLLHHFSSIHSGAVSINLAGAGIMAFSSDKQNPLLPRYLLIAFPTLMELCFLFLLEIGILGLCVLHFGYMG
uniref:DUF3700 domain-containing protein n=1 Tax=Opuntia streptacantha TaxID=393608 RepID=A0A7C8YXX5_OPUST